MIVAASIVTALIARGPELDRLASVQTGLNSYGAGVNVETPHANNILADITPAFTAQDEALTTRDQMWSVDGADDIGYLPQVTNEEPIIMRGKIVSVEVSPTAQ